jgi:uncharacterized protein YukE
MGLLEGILMEFAAVQEAQRALQQQQQNVSDLVDMVSSFTNIVGAAWKGDDAEQFPIDLNQKVIMALTGFGGGIGSFIGQINSAMDRMEQADQAVDKIVDGVSDLFDAIF